MRRRCRAEGRHARHLCRHVAGAEDLGFAPTVGSKQGLEAEYQWLTEYCDRLRETRSSVRNLGRAPAPLAAGAAARRARARRRRAAPCRTGTHEPDKFLFDKGTEALNNKNWLNAREFFKQVIDTYPQSPYRADAKLGIGDTYLGEGSSEALVLAINEFSEFLSFYPTNRARRLRAVQARDGALLPDASCRSAIRPKRATAIKELETFVAAVSEQHLMPEAEGTAARGARSPERGRLPRRLLLLPPEAGIRARSIGSSRCSRTIRSTRTATRSTSISPMSLVKVKQAGGGAPLSRKAGQGIRAERVSRPAQKMIAELKAQVSRNQVRSEPSAAPRVMRACGSPWTRSLVLRLCSWRARRRRLRAAARRVAARQLELPCAPPPTFEPPPARRCGSPDAGSEAAHPLRRSATLLVMAAAPRRASSRTAVLRPPVSSPTASSRRRCVGFHDAGWIRIVAVNDTTAIATVNHACDGSMVGDYLETFAAADGRRRHRVRRPVSPTSPRSGQRRRRRRRSAVVRRRRSRVDRSGHSHGLTPAARSRSIATPASPACRWRVGEASCLDQQHDGAGRSPRRRSDAMLQRRRRR